MAFLLNGQPEFSSQFAIPPRVIVLYDQYRFIPNIHTSRIKCRKEKTDLVSVSCEEDWKYFRYTINENLKTSS